MTWRSDPGPGGFTLMEMLVVIAIIGLVMVLFTVGRAPVSPAIHARSAAEAISAALRRARSEAVMRNTSTQFTFDLGRRSYGWSGAPAEALPVDVSIALLASADEVPGQSLGRIQFNPDGSSSGGRIAVSGNGRTWWVGVDWLSGRVSSVEKPR